MKFIAFTLFLAAFQDVTSEKSSDKIIASVFEALGYSPSCIATALAVCEDAIAKDELPNNKKSHSLLIANYLQELKGARVRPRNCAELLEDGDVISGVRTVYPFACCPNRPVAVFCDQNTDDGGWTVIQRRDALPQRENFYRTWFEYVLGFGNLTGEFWLGLDNIHALVSTTMMELRVDLEDFESGKRWAKYRTFHVGDSSSKYVLHVFGYTGDAGDGLGGGRHNGHKFSTHDRDHDTNDKNCAESYRGGWWYDSCHISNLNGFQYEGKHASYADGINWYPWKEYNYSLKRTMILIRPAFKNT